MTEPTTLTRAGRWLRFAVGPRTAWLVALLPLLVGGLLIGAVGEGERDRTAVDALPEGYDSTQAVVLAEQREIFLMGAHGGGEHLVRQAHEGLVDRSDQHDRPLRQARDLVQERLVGLDAQILSLRDLLGVRADRFPPLLLIEDDVSGAQMLAIFRKVPDRKALRRQEPVAGGAFAVGNVVGAEIETNGLAVEKA